GGDSVGSGQGSERPYRQAQEWGLPSRITGVRAGAEPFADAAQTGRARKEVVIENDIGWRVETLVDYLFGKPLVVSSAAPDPARRQVIGRLVRAVLAHNGGVQLLQQMATLGTVHGFVDVLVKYVAPAEPIDAGALAAAHPTACGTRALGEAPATCGNENTGEGEQPPPGDASPGAQDAAAAPGGSGDSRESDPGSGNAPATDALLQRVARTIRLEIVEPARALPLLSAADYRAVDAYAQVWETDGACADAAPPVTPARGNWWERLRSLFTSSGGALAPSPSRGHQQSAAMELITADRWFRIEGGEVVALGPNSLGRVPLVHVQNTAEAFAYAGASDVEPLIPLQDELNTRLSDRAHRITLQSFRMYLAKGLEHFTDQPVSPGRMWLTDNPDAEIDEFGGDAACPSEDAHIADLREAMDKSSGVSPIAAGAIKNRIGRLTSAAALRITLMALLSKTDKKRTLYGAAIEQMCELALAWLDAAGVFRTTADERRVEIAWPSPLPENAIEKLEEANAKVRLGVDRQTVLRELGY
ncbi:MAG: phage portal protein, partial [Phycisphaerae bacterium]